MKKLLVLALVLSMASMANAALTLTADTTQLNPSEFATISITGDIPATSLPGQFYMGIVVDGPGTFDLGAVTIVYQGTDASVAFLDNAEIAGMLGLTNPLLSVSLMDVPPPQTRDPYPLEGLLVDGIKIHCDGVGDVTISIFDGDGNPLSSVTIAQPEPITIGLLGLGAMFLRRRK